MHKKRGSVRAKQNSKKDLCTVKEHKHLAVLNKKLVQVDILKNDIIMNISHELRTPLTIASSAISLASKNCSKEQKVLMTRASRALKKQNRVIENLVEDSLAAKDKFRINKTRTLLESIVLAAMDELIPVAQDKNIHIISKVPKLTVLADKKELKHVMINLLDNALKFSKEGSKVVISAKKMKDSVKIVVKDEGIGIAKRYHKRIFDKLYQIDQSSIRTYGGAGMGLAIAKRIIKTHDGRIWVTSTKGRGTTVCITIPR